VGQVDFIHIVDATEEVHFLHAFWVISFRLHDLLKHALQQSLQILGAECLGHGHQRLALELPLELPAHLRRQRSLPEPSESHDGDHLDLVVIVLIAAHHLGQCLSLLRDADEMVSVE
jgi:hypothetical protein